MEDIIRDEKYTGTMVQLKTKRVSVGGKQVKCPREEWIRVENAHEPIITYLFSLLLAEIRVAYRRKRC